MGDTEAPDPVLDLVTFYSENLAVPARRDFDDPAVLRGKELFHEIGCINCHNPKFVTSRKAENKAHRFQLIWQFLSESLLMAILAMIIAVGLALHGHAAA